jgi:hypothetical protein
MLKEKQPMNSQNTSHFNAVVWCAKRVQLESPECFELIKPYLESPKKCFQHSKSTGLAIINILESYQALNKALSAELLVELSCLKQQIIRSFKIHISQMSDYAEQLNTSYVGNETIKSLMKKLINSSEDDFKIWADDDIKELEAIRQACQDPRDREAIFCLITLETRLFSLKNPLINASFEVLRAHLNDKTLERMAYPTHYYKAYQTLPQNIIDKLENIEYYAPNWFSRLINRFLGLFQSKPLSFFESHHASQLINKVSTLSQVPRV